MSISTGNLGGAIPQDKNASSFGGEARCLVVASTKYLASRGRPATPDDLRAMSAFGNACRAADPSLGFEKRKQEVSIDVPGTLMLDHEGATIQAVPPPLRAFVQLLKAS